ncbi:hypothetical protein [Prosthecobacter sp.]|uniref:hypothetical protein n=1 Tax=Prosthecobacter sp. TaxID=1965333 RepID=UPI001D7B2E36|nr:hypothetical protein [Prosthecobacter sp.]MCB1276532.1 hypothetical protein [Prosthecobacter sp.]
MNRHLRRTRLVAGVARPPRLKTSRRPPDESNLHAEHENGSNPPSTSTSIEDSPVVRIDEPIHFNWVRYEHLIQALHGKITLAAVLVSGLVLLMLGRRAERGEYISPERWLCGAGAGWFIAWMVRLALFTFLAAPRFVRFMPGRICLSGLGSLRPEHILHWKMDRGVSLDSSEKACTRLEICCRWFWWERRWAMFLNDVTQADLLHQLLKTRLAAKSKVPRRTWSSELRLKPES